MNYSNLRTLAEGAVGYSGGTATDTLPELTLMEAARTLPVVCLECQCDFIGISSHHNSALVEAAVTAVSTGTEMDASGLVEASMESIKKKIEEMFAKLKKFIESIFAKLTLAIDKMKMSGQALWTRYKDNKALDQDFSKSNLVISGYKFASDSAGLFNNVAKYDKDIEGLVKTAFKDGSVKVPAEFRAEMEKSSAGATGTQDFKSQSKVVDDLKAVDQKEREGLVVTALTGYNLGSDWQTELKRKLGMDTKVDIKYGENGFDKAGIGAILGSKSQLSGIKTQYENLAAGLTSYKSELDAELEKIRTIISKNGNDKEKTNETNLLSVASSYYSAYIAIVSQVISLMSSVKRQNLTFEKARYDQAKAMLVKMLNYKAPRDNNDASGDDTDELTMVEFEL